MALPHSSQTPKLPSSILSSAFWIFSRNTFSRPRKRNVKDCRYSLDAKSISSGRSSASRDMSSSRVCCARRMISLRFDSSSLRNFSSSAFFIAVVPTSRPLAVGPAPKGAEKIYVRRFPVNQPRNRQTGCVAGRGGQHGNTAPVRQRVSGTRVRDDASPSPAPIFPHDRRAPR